MHLPFDSTPDITNNQVQVITQAPSLGAQEVEQYITSPIEMALANIPRQEERRSISRSGLSVVTLVFDDGADIYWARSQISQVLEAVAKELPANADTELGPIATGLGEIFHYTVRPEKGYEDRYSLTQLRTIQDWIVRKQLAGTPGVAEVSGWGGYVKQYEVVVGTSRNKAETSVSKRFGKGRGIAYYLACVFFELFSSRKHECDCFSCYRMHQGPALYPRKYCPVKSLSILLFAEYKSSPRTSECFMRGRADIIRIRHRAGVRTSCYKPRNVGHVHEKYRPHLICYCTEAGKIYEPGISACACNYEFGPRFLSQSLYLVIVDRLCFPVYSVAYDVVKTA